MAATEHDTSSSNEVKTEDGRYKRSSFWFAFFLAFAVLSTLAVCFWLATTEWFLNHDAYPSMRSSGYSIRANHLNCDLVIYGDSTAMAGIDPRVLEQKTGLSACNVSEIRPALNVVGINYPLDRYLAQNSAPKVLISAWASSAFVNFAPPKMSKARTDGFIYGLRFNREPFLWKWFLRHPLNAAKFSIFVAESLLTDTSRRLTGRHVKGWQPDPRTERAEQLGFFTFGTHPQSKCDKATADQAEAISHAQNASEIEEFRKRYSVQGTKVLVDATPIASCAPDLQEDSAAVVGLTDNSLSVLPVGMFYADNIHLSPEAAAAFTQKVADQVNTLLKDDPRKEQVIPAQ